MKGRIRKFKDFLLESKLYFPFLEKEFGVDFTLLIESGNVFPDTSPILSEFQEPTLKKIEEPFLKKVLGLEETGYAFAGSTLKKPKGDVSNDLDIIVNGLAIGSNFELTFDEVIPFFKNKLADTFPDYDIKELKGLSIVSLSFPQYDTKNRKTDLFVQVDFIITDSLELAKFLYHSPDFKNNESKYKGVYRTVLIYDILRSIDLEDGKEYFSETEFDGKYKGLLKTFKKYSLTVRDGLKIQTKTFAGKRGILKNPKTLREADKILTKDVKSIIKIILGEEAKLADFNSFESLWDFIHSEKFIHKKYLNKIIENFKESVVRLGLPLPSELNKK